MERCLVCQGPTDPTTRTCGWCGHTQSPPTMSVPQATLAGQLPIAASGAPALPPQPLATASTPAAVLSRGRGHDWRPAPLPQPFATASTPASALVRRVPAPPGAKHPRNWPWYVFLAVIILGGAFSAIWAVAIGPALHQSTESQIRQGLQRMVAQIPSTPPDSDATPAPITAAQINQEIEQNSAQFAPLTQMHVSLQPGVLTFTFQTYGFGSTVRLGLGVEHQPGQGYKANQLLAQNVFVGGLLAWVESARELMAVLNEALERAASKTGHPLAFICIVQGQIQWLFVPF